jgi:hypothetical protein
MKPGSAFALRGRGALAAFLFEMPSRRSGQSPFRGVWI